MSAEFERSVVTQLGGGLLCSFFEDAIFQYLPFLGVEGQTFTITVL